MDSSAEWMNRADVLGAKNILIVRPDNLGDVVLFSGGLRAIREKWPVSKITVCVKRYVRDYLESCPYIDDILVWEEVSNFLYGSYTKRQLLRLNRRSAGWHLGIVARGALDFLAHCDLTFDLVLNPVRSPFWDHHMFVRALRAPVRIGISGDLSNQTAAQDRAAESMYDVRMHVPPRRKWETELQINGEFIRFLGIDFSGANLWPEVWTQRSDKLWAKQHLDSTDDSSRFRLGIAHGKNGADKKIYPFERISEAIETVEGVKFSCLIFGGEKDFAVSNRVEESLFRCKNVLSITNLCGRTSICQLIECLNVCDLVLAVDSAPLHIATALHKPTVGIIGGAHYGRFYPWGDPAINRVACKFMDCYFCNWICPESHASCVQDIPPSAIAKELEHLVRYLKKRPLGSNAAAVGGRSA